MSYFVPQLLNTLVGEPEADVKALFAAMQRENFDGSEFVAPNAQSRTALELERFRRFGLMFETLTDKYANALRTSALLQSGERAFVLLLHGFSLELQYDADQSIGYESDLGLYTFRFELARDLAPTPLVLVRNPAQSESLVGVFPGASEAAPTTFALDLDDTWETSVASLIDAASFIVVRNHVVREGLRTELRLLEERGRLNDVFFTDADEAQKLLPGKTVRCLDDGALALMRQSAPPRDPSGTAQIPPTCWWVQGDRRGRIGENVLAMYDLLNRRAESGQRMPLDMQARFLAFAVAGSVLLERVDLIVMSVASYAQCVASYNSERLPDAAEIADRYMAVVQALASAIDNAATGPDVFDYYDLPHIKALLEVEAADVLIPETMNVVQLCLSGS